MVKCPAARTKGNETNFEILYCLVEIVMMAAYYLAPIYTSPEKRQLICDHIKGPLVAAIRSPLMKALDRSVETLCI